MNRNELNKILYIIIMSKRKTLVKEKIIDPEEEAKIKEELYSVSALT